MKPLQLKLDAKQIEDLEEVYHQTDALQGRTRAQIILLVGEQQMRVPQVAKIVRKSEQRVRRWVKRYQAEGVEGLSDQPRPGAPKQVTAAYKKRLQAVVRRRPRRLDQPYWLWTLARLADFLAEETGLRFSTERVRRILKANDIVLSRPQHKISSPDPQYQVKKRRLSANETNFSRGKSSITPTNSISVGSRP